MGLLNNIFHKKEKEERVEVQKQIKDEVRMESNNDGSQFFEYYESSPRPGQMYDTTRVIIKGIPEIINGETLYECLVSWFGRDDAIMITSDGEEIGSRTDFKKVVAGIDPALMRENPKYLEYAIKGLLGKNRIERYISNSLKTERELSEELEKSPESGAYPCGRYIGKIGEQNGKFIRQFNAQIGKILHNTDEMRNERDEYRKSKNDALRRKIAERNAEIARLREEAEQYERDLGE